MKLDLSALSSPVLDFLAERQLASLTTLRADGRLHVVPVGFTYDPATATARVITSGDSVKARNAGLDGARGALCSVEGARWLTLTGPLRIDADPAVVRDAEARYAARYRTPRENPRRVVVIMDVIEILASTRFRAID